ncbi:MAG: hypothetical protein ACLFSB_12675 [Chitinispirillaceae bacterium]
MSDRFYSTVHRCLIIVLFFSLVGIKAQSIRYAGELMHLPIGCRTVGLGNASVALDGMGNSSYWNPALAALSDLRFGIVEGARLYEGLSDFGSVAAYTPVQNGLVMGALYSAFFSGDITEWDSLPGTKREREASWQENRHLYEGEGIFHNNQHVIVATVAKTFSLPIPRPSGFSTPMPVDISAGLNFKYYWQTITPEDKVRMGMNVNVDVGAALQVGVDYDLNAKQISRKVIIGASVRNALPTEVVWMHSYQDYTEPVDYCVLYGISYSDQTGFLWADWTLSLSVKRLYTSTVQAGIEGVFWDCVAIRAGIDDKCPTFGAGLRIKMFSFDYAFSFDEVTYSPLRLSLGVQF